MAPDPEITVSLPGAEPLRCTLSEFLRENADGMDEREQRAIAAAVGAGAVYIGGGGAAPEFTIERAPPTDPKLREIVTTLRGVGIRAWDATGEIAAMIAEEGEL